MDGKRFKSKIKLSTPQIITLGFAGVIFVGGLLLWLPWATVEGEYTSFTDAMFTSTTSGLCDRARHTGHSDTLDVVWENRDFGTDSGGRPGNCIFGESGVHHSSKEN